MFKIHFGKEGHSLTQNDFDDLARRTDGFSGSDISNLAKQALMLPVQRMQKAEYFKIDSNGLYVVCEKDEPGAEKKSLYDIPNGKVAVPTFTKVREGGVSEV